MGLTRIRSAAITDIDYKRSAKLLQDSNIVLSGGAPLTVDGVTVTANDRILVVGQTNLVENGIYRVVTPGTGSDGTWIRTDDANESYEVSGGMTLIVTSGTNYADTQWKLITDDPITLGTTELSFSQTTVFAFGNVYANGTAILADATTDTLTLTAGNNLVITGNASTDTIDFHVSPSGNAGEIQFNNNGSLGASSKFSFDGNNVSIVGNVIANNFDSVNADLAEKYQADSTYEPGTVIVFGGNNEVTISINSHDTSVAGVISTAPAYIMNSDLTNEHTVPVALQGRVPCRVVGKIKKGDRMVASDLPGVATALDLSKYQPGCIIGKALENYDSENEGIIEIVVGRL